MIRAHRGLITRGLRPVNRLLDFAERRLLRPRTAFSHPPIFILGVPRSGTTLLYQSLIARFDLGYLSNLHCRFYGSPVAVERLVGNRLRQRPGGADFDSVNGRTEGWRGPSECGAFWYRWFPLRPQYRSLTSQELEGLSSLRQVLVALSEERGAPMIYKNLVNSVRLGPLGTLLPEALFIVIRRDPDAAVRSILHSRNRSTADPRAWWSVQPPGFEGWLNLSPEEQVRRQVAAIEGLIEEARIQFGAERFHEVRYERLCAQPGAETDAVARFTARRGLELSTRGKLPERFESGRREAANAHEVGPDVDSGH